MGAIERVLEAEHVGHAAVLVHRLEDMQLAEGNRRLVLRLRLRGADGAERLGKRARRAFEPSRRPFDGLGPRRLALARPQILVGHLVPFVSALANRTGRCVLLSRGLTVGDRSAPRCSGWNRLNHLARCARLSSRGPIANPLRAGRTVCPSLNILSPAPMLPYPRRRGQIIPMLGSRDLWSP